jgi:2-polyprenyl-3-methyl-5-hydroxy-6-metoxy-1,4-benzoquinol methylase
MSLKKELTACPLCSESLGRQLYRFEPALWIPGQVIRCAGCGGIYKKPSENANPIADYYRDPRYHQLEYWSFEEHATRALRRIRDTVASALGKTDSLSLLDIGCGPGEFLRLAQEIGFEASGVELNAGNAEEARRRTCGASVIRDDFMTAPFDRQFDVIAMLDLIEHLPDPLAAIRRTYELLKPGGHLVVYTPNHSGITVRAADLVFRLSGGAIAGPVTEIFDCPHVVFFDVKSLRSALERNGFRVVKTAFSPYDPARNNQARGASAWGVRALEAVGSVFLGQFRLLMLGRK